MSDTLIHEEEDGEHVERFTCNCFGQHDLELVVTRRKPNECCDYLYLEFLDDRSRWERIKDVFTRGKSFFHFIVRPEDKDRMAQIIKSEGIWTTTRAEEARSGLDG
jgi:hypothetical protein